MAALRALAVTNDSAAGLQPKYGKLRGGVISKLKTGKSASEARFSVKQ
jgi:hypothetical protein